jgi:hypothetical protein
VSGVRIGLPQSANRETEAERTMSVFETSGCGRPVCRPSGRPRSCARPEDWWVGWVSTADRTRPRRRFRAWIFTAVYFRHRFVCPTRGPYESLRDVARVYPRPEPISRLACGDPLLARTVRSGLETIGLVRDEGGLVRPDAPVDGPFGTEHRRDSKFLRLDRRREVQDALCRDRRERLAADGRRHPREPPGRYPSNPGIQHAR